MTAFTVEIKNLSVDVRGMAVAQGTTQVFEVEAADQHEAANIGRHRAFGDGFGAMTETRNSDGSWTATLTTNHDIHGRFYCYVAAA